MLQLAQPMLQDQKVGFGRDGQLGIETLDEKATLVENQFEFLVLKRLGVRVAEDRQKNFVLEHHAGRVPVDIKKRSVGRAGAVFQDIHPPGILASGGHVVRDDVQEEAHLMFLELRRQGLEVLLAPNFTIDVGGIGDVVAVQTSAPRLQQRRRVDIRHPKLVQGNPPAPARARSETAR